ncbi:MAG TPA: hypothetical protein ENI80_03850 [Acidiferrobacteraceae bacterium]|nr:hypothetical protein [Acidiferrobacteraceae bacterium]
MSDKKGWPATVLGLFLGSFLQVAEAQIEVSGYYKNLLIGSRTLLLFPPTENYTADLNRLHLRFQGDLGKRASFDVQYENEIILGDYLNTQEFIFVKEATSETYFNLENTYLDSSNGYGRQSLYRAYVDLAFDKIDLRIGRQRIAWGSALFWSPVDILNPFSPTQLERERRVGVDAIVLDWSYGDLSRLSLVYAAHGESQRASTAVRWRTNKKGFDWALTAGRLRDDDVIGLDFSGQLGKVGLRGEIARTNSPVDGVYTRAVLGADYTFPNTLSLNVELYYNGQGVSESNNYDFPRLISGELQGVAQRYMGSYLGYEITTLLRWENYWILNIDDSSLFFSPVLVYSFTGNVEGSVGAQFFNGGSGSEYGTFNDLYYAQLQWFF